jgi:hypothetical protein
MSLFDLNKLNLDNNQNPQNTQRGDFQWKDESRNQVIFVPNENGRFLIQIR